MLNSILKWLDRNPKIIPVALALLFLAFTIPGIQWGAPALWNPDELIWRVDQALIGELKFDETEPDFNYPSLAKYVMFGIGKIVYGLGYSQTDFIVTARIFSAVLGALGVVLVYALARKLGARPLIAGLAGLFYIASGVVSANARLAHNDIYLLFFAILCVWFAVEYHFTKSRLWIYASFISVGLAASSKYTGGSLLLTPIFTLIVLNWAELKRDWLKAAETFFIGGVVCFGGYALGTPKALLWMTYYFKRAIPAVERLSLYNANAGTPIGLFGQWGAFQGTVGTFFYALFGIAALWFLYKLLRAYQAERRIQEANLQALMIVLASLAFFDLPFLSAVHYLPRHFIPFVPFLSILGALFIQEALEFASVKAWKFAPAVIGVVLCVGIAYAFLGLISKALLFMYDARMPASAYIAKLPGAEKTVEYTLYPPVVNKAQFEKAYNYPIYFVKYPNETVPTGGRYALNQGEQGLLERDTDYLVIDTFTYARFSNPAICATNPVECDFFKRLLAGEVASFRLIKEFTYQLPPYLPQISEISVNPEVRIYERVR
ncbi:MAG: phospholipid carrier-dependent glycosyltransferase [Anaerolineales bacterium]|nr:phospholipid carrier-dependent glycosyltransferase [Anaerolineales bacterium]